MGLALLLALLIDAFVGEPPVRWHPVVWMGRCLQWSQNWVFAANERPSHQPSMHFVRRHLPFLPAIFWRGAIAWLLLALGFTGLAWGVEQLLAYLPWPLGSLLMALALKPMLAWRMLRQEVQQVELALQQSLPQGQQQLARLVSRDTTVLDATQVRESALESLSENLNDSVIAPLFWFAVLGLPGAVLYRLANTADAMWGYPGERGGRYWWWAGKWAARSDDVLSAVPARISAALLLVGAWLLHGLRAGRSSTACQDCTWRRLRYESGQTTSPNGGWPMAAMALLLGVRLSKPGVYVLHAAGRSAEAQDTYRAVRLASAAVVLGAVLAIAAMLWVPGLPVYFPFAPSH